MESVEIYSTTAALIAVNNFKINGDRKPLRKMSGVIMYGNAKLFTT